MKYFKKLTSMTVVPRALLALFVTLMTYNPWPGANSIIEWFINTHNKLDPVWMFGLAILALLHFLFIAATVRSLGGIGIVIGIVVVAFFMYMMIGKGWLDVSFQMVEWTIVMTYAFLMGVGASFAILWRKATGQIATIDTSDNVSDEQHEHSH